MTETQKRIQAYKKALPGMKERVTAVAMLLVMSVAMMTSATFAWMALSRSPEISSIATTVTTNGNLEIALSDTDGKEPDETTILTDDQRRDVTKSNLTWGNLINLSDACYGLDYLTLRPATLNTSNLISSPLYTVEYDESGRIKGYFTDFGFTNFKMLADGSGIFEVPTDSPIAYGVRAVSTVTYTTAAQDAAYKAQMDTINQNASSAKDIFDRVIGNDAYIATLKTLVETHVNLTLNGGDASCAAHIDNLVSMMTEFKQSVDMVGQTMVDIANLHLYIEDPDSYIGNEYKLADLMENNYSNAFVTKYKGVIAGLDDYVVLAKKTDAAYDGILDAKQVHRDTGDVYWLADNLDDAANLLCNMNSATVAGQTAGDLKSSIAEDPLGAAGLLSGTQPAVIKEGALVDLDLMLGQPTMSLKGIKVSAKYIVQINMTVDITTAAAASDTFILPEDIKDAEAAIIAAKGGGSYKGTAAAAETYAMALDFWVRTNDERALLILEGEYLTEIKTVDITGTDASGLEVPLYSYTFTENGEEAVWDVYQAVEQANTYYKASDHTALTAEQVTAGTIVSTDRKGSNSSGQEVSLYSYTFTENGEEVTWDVYKVTEETITYYKASDHTALTAEQVAAGTIAKQTEEIETVVGYKGINRVWDELDNPDSNYSELITNAGGTSTTQGAGSCYVFYPESPEDQERCISLLSSMRVAFADEEGKLLGEAQLDTENAIEDAGRVIVPLVMRPQSAIVVGTDESGDEITTTDYITPLRQNVATRITAIMYLNGTHLSNSDVLAARSINGQMNIQFGTNQMEMQPMEEPGLMKEYYVLDWVHPDQEGKTNKNRSFIFNGYDEETCKIKLQLDIKHNDSESDANETKWPTSVKGNFISYISETQGVREKVFELVYNPTTKYWETTVGFSGPGSYKLRALQIDGVDISLIQGDGTGNESVAVDNSISVEIKGVKVTSLTCSNWSDPSSYSYMTAESSYQQEMFLMLGTNDTHSVQGVFLGNNNQTVTVDFISRGNNIYSGTGNFTSSGTYKLTYVLVDGQYTSVDPAMYKTLNLRLGLRVTVTLARPVDEYYLSLQSQYEALTDEDQKAAMQKTMEDYLQTLYVGSEDDSSDSMELRQDASGNWHYLQDGERNLSSVVSLIITDDQNKPMENLGNVELAYNTSGGGAANRLTAGVKWNSTTTCYEGTLNMGTVIGIYSFEYVTINGKDSVSKAASATAFTAMSPDPMQYPTSKTEAPAALVYDLSGNTPRTFTFQLVNAAAANIAATLTQTTAANTGDAAVALAAEDDGVVTRIQTIDNGGIKVSTNQITKVSTFTITVPSDGEWTLSSLQITNVFFDGQFYAEGTDHEWLELDLTKLYDIASDESVTTHFLTEVELYAYNLPTGGDTQFMQSVQFNNMYITVTNQNRPLVDVLKELQADAKYEKYEIDPTVDVFMQYKWTKKMSTWEADVEKPVFGGTRTMSTAEASYGQYAMGNMNFKLDGEYAADFKLTIAGANSVIYSYDTINALTKSFKTNDAARKLEDPVTVKWAAPRVKITGVSTDTHDGVELSSGEVVSGINNYYEDYYASTYFYVTGSFLGQNSFAVPQVQLTVDSGAGNATSAMVTASSNNGSFSTTYTLTKDNDWTESKDIGATTNGGYTRSVAGTVTANQIVLSDGTAKYTFTIPSDKVLTINNAAYPHYLTLSADTTKVDMPATITCTNYKGETFTVNTGGASSVRIFSPDGRAFNVTLPTLSRVVIRNDDQLTGDVTYDNESGTAVAGNFMSHQYTEPDNCGNDVTYYDHYQRYERIATKTGMRTVYEDTYTMSIWSVGAAGTSTTVNSTSTITSENVDVSSRQVRTESLAAQKITEYCYKLVAEAQGSSQGTIVTDVTKIQTTWTE